MLKKIEFENYRCFQKTTLEFRDIAIIVGKNNAGKSTIVEALRLVAAAEKKSKNTVYKPPPKSLGLPILCKGFSLDVSKLRVDLRNVIFFYDKGDYAKITACFSCKSTITVYLNREIVFVTLINPDGKMISYKSQASKLSIGAIDILPQIGLIKENEARLTEQTVKADKDTYLSSRHFRNELLLFQDDYYDDFKSIAEQTWPGLRILGLEYKPYESEYIALLVQDDSFPAEIGLMGSGLQMWLQIIWFISRCAKSDTIILDEPDVYMHPDMQRKILDIIRNKYKQVIIATHSVEIISAVDEQNIITVEKTARKMRYANNLKAVQSIIDNLGSVHNLALVRLANSKKCLFVEGKDMRILSRIYDKLGILSKQPIDTLPCIALGGFSKLTEAFGAARLFHEETKGTITCHCILDRDYFSDEYIENQINAASEAHLHLHIWKKKEIENYFLIPQALFRISGKPNNEYELFCERLEALIDTQKDDVVWQYTNQLYMQDPRKKDIRNYHINAAKYVSEKWISLDDKLSIISGKSTLSLINKWMKEEYNSHCSLNKIISTVVIDEIDNEMVDIIKTLSI